MQKITRLANLFFLPAIFCVLGVFITLQPMFTPSFFGRIPGEPIDVRWNNYTLEHSFRWITGWPNHTRLWSPPYFYPEQNTGAYSDILLGAAPIYWFWRVWHIAPDTAFQLYLIANLAASFLITYELLRFGYKVSRLAGSVGAYLFAFGGPVISQLGHPQLLTQFYSVLAIYALIRIFTPKLDGRKPHLRKIWIAVFFTSAVLQIYTAFYIGWFLLFLLLLALIWTLLIPRWQTALFSLVSAEWQTIVVSALIAAAALFPLIQHYANALDDFGYRSFADTRGKLPLAASYFYHGQGSLIYGWITSQGLADPPPQEHEQRIGIGIVTLALAVLGLAASRKRSAYLFALTAATAIALSLRLHGNVTLWHIPFETIPGAGALRAVSRISLPLLLPAAVGVSLALHHLIKNAPSRTQHIILLSIALFTVLEQIRVPASFDKLEAASHTRTITSQIHKNCQVFYYTADTVPPEFKHKPDDYGRIARHIEAMWVSLIANTPTINGYSGQAPKDWPLKESILTSDAEKQAASRNLRQWIKQKNIDPAAVCWIHAEELD